LTLHQHYTTDERYVQPFPRDVDYVPEFPESDDEVEKVVQLEGEKVLTVEIAAQAVAQEAAANARREAKRRGREKLIPKLREGVYEGHRKAMETQKANKRTAYPMMWRKMRLASQNRVREEEDF
jgi:hypothetical protein